MSVVHEGKYDNLDPRAWTYDLGKSRAVATDRITIGLCLNAWNLVPVIILKIQWDKLPNL